jgi:hypothetical protein
MSIKTHFNDISNIISNYISDSKEEIVLAVAWLTNKVLYDQLCYAAIRGVDVQVLIVNDDINKNSECDLTKLENYGGKIFWQKEISGSLMHHKFCVIDKRVIITGSFNWTNKAQINKENVIVIENEPQTVIEFLKEFKNLIPISDEIIYFKEGYLPNTYFDSPGKRQNWYDSLSDWWKSELKENAKNNYNDKYMYHDDYPSFEDKVFDDKLIEMLNLTKVWAADIEDFTGLYHLSDLIELWTPFNQVGNINAYLKSSDLSPIENLIKLEKIDIPFNDIKELTPLQNLSNLKEINLRCNKIKDISPLSYLRKVEKLDLTWNLIEDISPIANMYILKELRISHNQVTKLEGLESKAYLNVLEFTHNQIEDLTPLYHLDFRRIKWVSSANNKYINDEVLDKIIKTKKSIY